MALTELFNRNTIRAQIVFAFFTLASLIVSLEIFAYFWTRQLVVINSLKEGAARLKEKQVLVKSASNEFILREKANESFFSSGKSIYLDRYAEHLRDLRQQISEIEHNEIYLGIVNREELKVLREALTTYDKVFFQMVDQLKARGYGKHGLIGEFDKSIQALLQYDFGTDNAAVVNLQLFVKDYLLTGDKKLIENISNEVFNFTMVLESHIRDEEVEKVSGILHSYETTFMQLTEADVALGIYTGGGLQSKLFAASDDLDKAILLDTSNAQIARAYDRNVFKLYLSFLLIVVAAVSAAYLINRNLFKILVKPIQAMKVIIAKMARGEVPDTQIRFGVKDLNEMADALNNLMAGTRNYRHFANAIGKGDLDTSFKPLSDADTLGQSLMVMRENLKANAEDAKRRAWASQGMAEIGTLIRSAESDARLYDDVLRFIVKYLNCNQGSLFLLCRDDQQSYLEMKACYAWEKKKFIEKKIALGDGLIGQCALEKDITLVTSLPKEYIRITSGLGGSNPNSLLIAPLVANEQVVGVVELASFKRFENHQIELVKKFAEGVAAAINTESTRQHTQTLLRQAQQQAERLQQQEEELRQNVEELKTIHDQTSRKLEEAGRTIEQLREELRLRAETQQPVGDRNLAIA